MFDPAALPKPAHAASAANGLERWQEAATATSDRGIIRFAANLARDPTGRHLLEAVFGNSPFLTRCLLAEVGFVQCMIRDGPDRTFRALIETLQRPPPAGADGDGDGDLKTLMAELRVAKRRVALIAGLADIGGLWPLERVTGALSELAGTALRRATAALLRQAAADGAFRLRHPDDPERESGFVVLGMGKLGARELNYSSDIDLIVLYDPERIVGADGDRLQERLVRLTRELVRVMQERTAEGYVFRTDLRLRPDPGATPPAMSVLAAETYYESMGQNWERAALIKARPVAGDRQAGKDFLRTLRPFIWRKHLDFAAIEDIHSIKRQIAAHGGYRAISVAGHNVKLGRGGIREIEFFAQTQQLIWGGRDPSLRIAATCEALEALVEAGRIAPVVADELTDSYAFLRRLEHRLQMIDDQQTHVVPKEPERLAALATFLGYADTEAFSQALRAHLERVDGHYGALFKEGRPLAEPGNLVFTGSEHDPDTLATLAEMGFADPARVSTSVRQWHHGRYRAVRSVRARELLTELMPTLLGALAGTANPDAAFGRFDEFLAKLPAGVQLFSLFHANPQLLDLVAEVMGSAPYLAELLSRRPELLDAVLSADFVVQAPGPAELGDSLDEALAEAGDFQDVLDIARRWTNDHRFQIGMQILLDVNDGDAAGPVLTDIAETALERLQAAVEDDFARRHGRIAGAALSILALGKFGGRELTPASDLDLVFVFDCPEDADSSDGPKPLTPGHYFARLGQSLISAITAPTGEGKLYEVDVRLRPSGSAGTLVPGLRSFLQYQRQSAWTWEHMALTRARPISGSPALRKKVAAALRRLLLGRRDAERLLADVAAMRRRIAEHNRPRSAWDIKHMPGGLVDLEFLAQYLMLRHGAERPEVLDVNTTGALERLVAQGCLGQSVGRDLIETVRLWRRIQGMLRLTLGTVPPDEEAIPEGLKRVLVRAGRAKDFDDLKARIQAAAARARAVYEEIVEEPAKALPEAEVEAGPGEAR